MGLTQQEQICDITRNWEAQVKNSDASAIEIYKLK